MGSLGWTEIVVIFVVALVIFGPRKLPELGKSLGRGLAEFKRASNDLRRTWEQEVKSEEESLRQSIEDQGRQIKKNLDPIGDEPI